MNNEFDLSHTNGINIPHLSASTINSFITNRFGFYQSKVKGKPFQGNEYTCRGTAVEHAVNCMVEGGVEDLLKAGMDRFDEECKKSGVNKFDAEEVRETLPGLIDLAIGFYRAEFIANPAITQRKIECELDGVTRTILGYLDFFQMSVAVRDSKVVSKTPSKLSQSYVLQGALYRKATGLPVTFDFFIPNKKPVQKSITLSDDEYIFGLSYLTVAAKAIEEIEECTSPSRMMELMSFPDLSSMYNDRDRKEAAEMWGIVM